jgi:hypothetical protein
MWRFDGMTERKRDYTAQIRKLWVVVEKLALAEIRIPRERVSNAYNYLVSSLSPDAVPEAIRERFETLCREFREDQATNFPQNDYILAAKMNMRYSKVRYFAKSIFEICRDGIQSETSDR